VGLPDYEIKVYTPDLRNQVEEFREQTFKDGNQSLAKDKFDPDNFEGRIWLLFVGNKLVSLSACEASHYTSDPLISSRVVRLHTLKAYRSTAFGMSFIPLQIEWCKKAGYKIMWWSIDINNKGLNAIYQRRHVPLYTSHKEVYETQWKSVVFDKSMLFEVDPQSDLLQYVYYFVLEAGYQWKPRTNMLRYNHDGNVSDETAKLLSARSRGWRPGLA
jgi:GNAT superfamily N-acetyltransferase